MAHNRSFFEALDRSEARRDGGYKQNWSFSLSGGSEEERRHDTSVVTMDEMDGQQQSSPDGQKSPAMRRFSSADPLKTYENRANSTNHIRALNKYSFTTMSQRHNRTDYLIVSPTQSQGVVLQGRQFQHTHRVPAAVRKSVHSSLDLKERKDHSTTQQQIQPVEVESIILTCPESPDNDNLIIKRRVQQQSRKALLEGGCSSPTEVHTVEPLHPNDYLTVCGKCNKSSENHTKCEHCGNLLAPEALRQPTALPASPVARAPIRPHPNAPLHPSPSPNSLSKSSFYGTASTMRVPNLRMDAVMNPPAPVRVTTRAGLLSPHNGRLAAGGLGASCCAGKGGAGKGRRTTAARQHELNDPIVLSSDDDDDEEEEEADRSSTGSVNRLDSISPRPADSAHSSPAPSGGRVEAAVKSSAEEEQEEVMSDFCDIDSRIAIPRRNRMKDQFGNQIPDDSTPKKKQRLSPNKLDSIILDCRSVRVGTLRRMVTKPVIFTADHIQLETEGPEIDALEKVRLRASELISCEWCNVRKLPVLFFQTTPEECLRLRTQLKMSRDKGGLWYDCTGNDSDEKYIVLIFENGLSMHEQLILEEILSEIGQANNISSFPAKLTFDEANIRLVNYNKATKEKVSSGKNNGSKTNTPVPVARTRMSTRQRISTLFDYDDDEDDDMAELQPTFTGPIRKLIVYPPPPAKGGISVTNEDLHCLNDGEFLNDVIIDFYLKYLVLEKLKKADSQRSHVFSSFFYKRLNQRERRNVPDAANLPIQKRKHNRVKTWTRHVDLFQKDFIFVPINESAHWYLAVICFPGLQGPRFESNPLYQAQEPVRTQAVQQGSPPDHCRPLSPEPDHCEPLSPGREEPVAPSEMPRLTHSGPSVEGHPHDERPARQSPSPDGSSEPPKSSGAEVSTQPQFTDGLHRISVCYGSGGDTGDDTYTFSDDQSSCQDECSEDGTLAEEPIAPDSSALSSTPNICKQPCILIMDSLRGPTRSSVVKTLREYLEVEWEVKKGNKRGFGKDQMKGSSPRVPQQDNFSDCGVYILQYVESFFENPLPSFHLPMNLADWFPQQRMKTKREEIKELILKIQTQQETDKKEAGQGSAKGSPGGQEVGEEDSAEGVEIQIQNLPVST
ncbi:sentrin-specific protease 6 isoform X3 [Esox lucius]|uniref:sentrin-specific protease 6 isoform X3 n=1 Tax=Esox lucius TaxID=8010 RepID=UPI0014771447|nr:sentrin-specific protease 6 isoform X3 [Esox lucius]